MAQVMPTRANDTRAEPIFVRVLRPVVESLVALFPQCSHRGSSLHNGVDRRV